GSSLSLSDSPRVVRQPCRRAAVPTLMPKIGGATISASVLLLVAACGDHATIPLKEGFGDNPTLPPPKRTLLPTMRIAPARGWTDGAKPIAADGLAVNAFATELDHPRWLYVLPNGDVLVAETNAPPRPEDRRGIRGWVMKKTMARAGAAAPSANRITLLRDENHDGVADR